MPNAAVATPAVPARVLPAEEAAGRERDAELHARVFGHEVRFVAALGEWEYRAVSCVGTEEW